MASGVVSQEVSQMIREEKGITAGKEVMAF
jgi:hypothetical protein